jgi:hypothetical protein
MYFESGKYRLMVYCYINGRTDFYNSVTLLTITYSYNVLSVE